MHLGLIFLGAFFMSAWTLHAQAPSLKTENVFLIISDGLRWQEIFNGAEERLINVTNGGVKNIAALRTNFWRETPELRRAALFPFLWRQIAQSGQIFGNPAKGSLAKVTNTRRFSYPGYNEMLTGAPDERIDSNDKKPNVNTNVFEWLQDRPGFRDRVVVFGTWDAFPFIFNCQRSRLPIWPTWGLKLEHKSIRPSPILTSILADTTPVFEEIIQDSFLIRAATDYIEKEKPRLVFVGFGETDEWAHAGRYDLYLEAAHNVDRYLERLWTLVQRIPQYRGKTTFLFSADHGRGNGVTTWKDHGEKIPESDAIWLAAIGPDTRPLGERSQTPPLTQNQIASTIAAFLGQSFHGAFPQTASPITDLVGSQ